MGGGFGGGMGGGIGGSHGAFDGGGGRSPWDSGAANSDLAREAGLNDIGGSSRAGLLSNDDRGAGLLSGDGDDMASDSDLGGGDSDSA
jgi:uncharacterized protein